MADVEIPLLMRKYMPGRGFDAAHAHHRADRPRRAYAFYDQGQIHAVLQRNHGRFGRHVTGHGIENGSGALRSHRDE